MTLARLARLGAAVLLPLLMLAAQAGPASAQSSPLTWNRDSPPPGTPVLNGVAFGDGTFVAVGYSGAILTSADGQSWSAATGVGTDNLRGVAFGDGTFVAVGDNDTVLTSPNGSTWTAVQNLPSGSGLTAVTYADGMFVAVGYNTVWTSPDGATWTAQTVPATTGGLTGVAFGNGTWVATTGFTNTLTSADATSWTLSSLPTFDLVTGVAFGDGLFVVVGDNTLLTSTDGTSWTSDSSQVSGVGVLYGITYADGLFVAVGNGVATSPDGSTWTLNTLPVAPNLTGVAEGAGVFAAVGGSPLGAPVPADAFLWATAPAAATTGTLTVTVVGVPAGSADVTVSGTGSVASTVDQVTGSANLTLPAGTYDVTAAQVTVDGLVYAGGVSGSPVTILAAGTGAVGVTYALVASYGNLRTLVGRYELRPGLARSLQAKLDAAQAAALRGNRAAVDGALGAFVHEVSAQTGKTLTAAQAAVLDSLAAQLQ